MGGRPLAVRAGMGRAQPRRRQSVGAVSLPQSRTTSLSAAIRAAFSTSAGLSVQVDPGSTGGGGQGDPSYRYVNPAAATNGNGLTWATAFNALPATLTRGLTYWLADGSYGSRAFNTNESGTTLITIKKATVAQHGEDASGGWSDAMGDGQATWTKIDFKTGYWMWDGTTGGGPGQWNTGFGFRINQTTDQAVDFTPTSGLRRSITVQHFEVIGTRARIEADAIHIGNLVSLGSGTLADITVRYYYFNNIARCPFFLAPGNNNAATNIVAEYGYVGIFGDTTNAIHAEICSAWAGATNIHFRYNLFTWAWGTGGIMWDAAGTTGGMHVYGNIFYRPAGTGAWSYGGNGLIGSWTGGNGEIVRNYKAYHNTFINTGPDIAIGSEGPNGGGNECRNFLFYNCPGGVGGGAYWAANSHHHVIGTTSGGTNVTTGSGDPFVDYVNLNFKPKVNTASGFAVGAPYNVDMFGTVRTTFTRGAIEWTP